MLSCAGVCFLWLSVSGEELSTLAQLVPESLLTSSSRPLSYAFYQHGRMARWKRKHLTRALMSHPDIVSEFARRFLAGRPYPVLPMKYVSSSTTERSCEGDTWTRDRTRFIIGETSAWKPRHTHTHTGQCSDNDVYCRLHIGT